MRMGSTRSTVTAAQYLVPLCQQQLPDVKPICQRVLTGHTLCNPTSVQVFSKLDSTTGGSEKGQPGASSKKILDSDLPNILNLYLIYLIPGNIHKHIYSK